MAEIYFGKFPTLLYDGKTTRNITERVAIDVTHDPRLAPTIYYPYELKNEMRADVVASMYYEDSNLDWLIHITNGMTDPYYDWHLTYDDFNNYLIKKYGSIEYSQQLIAYYRVDWAEIDQNVSIEYYNALPHTIKKYFQPNWNQKKTIISYRRREEDWTVNTNKIIQFDITLDNNSIFANNELIDVYNNEILTGHFQIIGQSNDNVSIIGHHIAGNTGVGNTCIGNTSNCYATITNFRVLSQPLSNDEFVYWQPVYFYDLERERNEKNKTIYLLDRGQLLPIVNQIRNKLSE